MGFITIPAGKKLFLANGQHREYAYRLVLEAISGKPELEHIQKDMLNVLIFPERTFEEIQVVFHDLNQHLRIDPSLNEYYDHRSDATQVAREVCRRILIFRALMEPQKNRIPNKSIKLFSFGAIHKGTQHLLQHSKLEQPEQIELAVKFWSAIVECFPIWTEVLNRQAAASEVRAETLNTQAVALKGLGRFGADLIKRYPDDWQDRIKAIAKLNWHRSNPDWVGILLQRKSDGTTKISATVEAEKKLAHQLLCICES